MQVHVVFYWYILCILLILSSCFGNWNGSQYDPQCSAVENWDSCGTCLSKDNTIWCDTGHCFIYNNSLSPSIACNGNCTSYYSSSGQCNPLVLNIIAIVFSFILLIVCPLCVLGACVIIVIARCRSYNKIAADMADFPPGPIPILPLHATASIPIPMIPQPYMASARILADADIDAEAHHFSSATVEAFAQPVDVTQPLTAPFATATVVAPIRSTSFFPQ